MAISLLRSNAKNVLYYGKPLKKNSAAPSGPAIRAGSAALGYNDSTGATGSYDPAITVPGSVAVNDTMWLWVASYAQGDCPATITGFTRVVDPLGSGSGNVGEISFWRRDAQMNGEGTITPHISDNWHYGACLPVWTNGNHTLDSYVSGIDTLNPHNNLPAPGDYTLAPITPVANNTLIMTALTLIYISIPSYGAMNYTTYDSTLFTRWANGTTDVGGWWMGACNQASGGSPSWSSKTVRETNAQYQGTTNLTVAIK